MNEDNFQDDMEISFLEMFYVLLKKWWLILIGMIVGAVVMMIITVYMITPMYRSQAFLYILSKTTSVTSIADIQIGSAVSADFEIIATSKPVIDGAIEKIKKETNKTFTRQDIKSRLEVNNIEDTRILQISVTDADPENACIIANAIAQSTASQMAEIMKSDPPTMVERAEIEKAPVSPSLIKNMFLGAFAMGFLICVILVIISLANDNIKTEEQVRNYLDAPTLATIPYISEKNREREMSKKKRRNKD